jgi:hypothetical protein
MARMRREGVSVLHAILIRRLMLHEPLDPGQVRHLVDQVVPFERAPTRDTV